MSNSATPTSSSDTFMGHPKGLMTLFFTEMWERMSYYGMRGILILFMTAAMQDGGMELSTATASGIYGLYAAAVYFMGVPGGWLADRLIGSQKAIWYGGIIIMLGHIVLAIPMAETFFLGLIFVVLGTGLLKPNISALVGQLYTTNDPRKDSGYAIYYMGINIGSVIGYSVCGYLIAKQQWHAAFGAAAIGMLLGLIIYKFTQNHLNNIGTEAEKHLSPAGKKTTIASIVVFLVILATITAMAMQGSIQIDPKSLLQQVGIAVVSVFFIYFFFLFFTSNLNATEMKGMLALLLVCIATACFFSGFEQAGSSLNLFARDFTDRQFSDFLVPTVWLQKLNPIFIVLLTPVFAAIWLQLGKRLITPAMGIKCAIGMLIMGSGFYVMYLAAKVAAGGELSPMFYLILTYFLHTTGELVLSPMALSAVSKLAPKRLIGQMMGLFVLTYSIGNVIAGLFAGEFNPQDPATMPDLFMSIFKFTMIAGVIILAFGFITRYWEKEAVENALEK